MPLARLKRPPELPGTDSGKLAPPPDLVSGLAGLSLPGGGGRRRGTRAARGLPPARMAAFVRGLSQAPAVRQTAAKEEARQLASARAEATPVKAGPSLATQAAEATGRLVTEQRRAAATRKLAETPPPQTAREADPDPDAFVAPPPPPPPPPPPGRRHTGRTGKLAGVDARTGKAFEEVVSAPDPKDKKRGTYLNPQEDWHPDPNAPQAARRGSGPGSLRHPVRAEGAGPATAGTTAKAPAGTPTPPIDQNPPATRRTVRAGHLLGGTLRPPRNATNPPKRAPATTPVDTTPPQGWDKIRQGAADFLARFDREERRREKRNQEEMMRQFRQQAAQRRAQVDALPRQRSAAEIFMEAPASGDDIPIKEAVRDARARAYTDAKARGLSDEDAYREAMRVAEALYRQLKVQPDKETGKEASQP